MRRILVWSTDLLFFSQVQGTARSLGWDAVQLRSPSLPNDGVEGDCLVVDATRSLEDAWKVLDAARTACPWLVLLAHQHLHPEVGEEALRRGATEVVRRGAILSRLAQRLGGKELPSGAPFVGEPTPPRQE